MWDHGFVTEQVSTLSVSDFARIEEKYCIRCVSIDVQRASLARVAEHLHHPRQVVVSQVAAQAGVRLGQHLRGLKTLCFA